MLTLGPAWFPPLSPLSLGPSCLHMQPGPSSGALCPWWTESAGPYGCSASVRGLGSALPPALPSASSTPSSGFCSISVGKKWLWKPAGPLWSPQTGIRGSHCPVPAGPLQPDASAQTISPRSRTPVHPLCLDWGRPASAPLALNTLKPTARGAQAMVPQATGLTRAHRASPSAPLPPGHWGCQHRPRGQA